MTSRKVRVLVVEDSPVVRELLIHILDADAQIEVIGAAANGPEALELLGRRSPDVITMDINMPEMDGFEVTRRIMSSQPVPIVIVSAAWSPAESAMTFRAFEAGAVAVVEKPRGPGHPDSEAMARKLVQTVKAMSEVRLVRRWNKNGSIRPSPAVLPAVPKQTIKLVAIGASTGGPPVLQTLLAALPPDFAVPVVIVQHIARGFLEGLVDWLEQSCGRPVAVARQGELALPGHVYLAPDDMHLGVRSSSDGLRLELDQGPPENGLKPAVSYLFRSVARNLGPNAAAVLLTGMGHDGAAELKLIKEKGGLTMAQDAATSVVHGMPGEAIKLGAATHILPPLRIAQLLKICCAAPPPAPSRTPAPRSTP